LKKKKISTKKNRKDNNILTSSPKNIYKTEIQAKFETPLPHRSQTLKTDKPLLDKNTLMANNIQLDLSQSINNINESYASESVNNVTTDQNNVSTLTHKRKNKGKDA